MANEDKSNEDIMNFLKNSQISMQFPNEFKYFILMCGLFDEERNIVKYWKKHEQCFVSLVQQDGELGIKHFFQSVILFFIRKYPSTTAYCDTFMKLLYD